MRPGAGLWEHQRFVFGQARHLVRRYQRRETQRDAYRVHHAAAQPWEHERMLWFCLKLLNACHPSTREAVVWQSVQLQEPITLRTSTNGSKNGLVQRFSAEWERAFLCSAMQWSHEVNLVKPKSQKAYKSNQKQNWVRFVLVVFIMYYHSQMK